MYQNKDSTFDRDSIEEKAIQKYPFHLNDKTYFSHECYFDDTIINGVMLSLKEGKGISSNIQLIDFLYYSQRLIYYVGNNILSYNTYKKMYDQIVTVPNIIHLKALSLRNTEKQYLFWVQKTKAKHQQSNLLNPAQKYIQKYTYTLILYDLSKRQPIIQQQFLYVIDHVDIFVFLHPVKTIGFFRVENGQTIAKFKFLKNKKKYITTQELTHELTLTFPHIIKDIKYNLETNEYFFMEGNSVYSFSLIRNPGNLDDFSEEFILSVETVLDIDEKKGKLIHYSINPTFLILLVQKKPHEKKLIIKDGSQFQINMPGHVSEDEDFEQELRFYSLFSREFIFSEKLQTYEDYKPISYEIPDVFDVSPSILVMYSATGTTLYIWSLYEQSLKFVKQINVALQNCCGMQRFYINPYNSEVVLISSHYEAQTTLTTTLTPSHRLIHSHSLSPSSTPYLETTLFHLTLDTTLMPTKKLSLRKRKYLNILTCSWLSEYYVQTDNSIICERWEEKLEYSIRCSALHPLGSHMILGSNQCFKVYVVGHEGLRGTFVSQVVKDCVDIQYKPDGNEFAVGTSGSVTVYHAYTYVRLHCLPLSISYKIKEISYRSQSNTLQLITQSRRLHCYSVLNGYREEFTFNPRTHVSLPNSNNSDTNRSNKSNNTIVEGLLGIVSQYTFHPIHNNTDNNPTALFYDSQVGVILFSLKNYIYFISSENYQLFGCFQFQPVSCFFHYKPLSTIFIGTISGTIICFPWPNKPINILSKLPTYNCHSAPVNKIKVSTDMLQLISITDQSIFKHNLSYIVGLRKVQKFQLQKQYNKQSVIALDFYVRRGFCLTTTDEASEKNQKIKQYEEQSMNLNFILPEERQRQKMNMIGSLRTNQGEVEKDQKEQMMPLQERISQIKKQIQKLKSQQSKVHQVQKRKVQEEILSYEKKFSELNEEKDKLITFRNEKIIQLSEELLLEKEKIKKYSKREYAYNYVRIKEFQDKNKRARQESDRQMSNFNQLSEIDDEKVVHKNKAIKIIQEEIGTIIARNGYLMSRNTNLQKEIILQRRKIEDLRDLVESTKQSIKKLKKKKKPKKIESQETNEMFYETQKRYLTQTKKTIQKNKAINISIQTYQKEKKILVILEKELDNTEKQIHSIIDYVAKQRREKKEYGDKFISMRLKIEELGQLSKKLNRTRVKYKNSFEDFKHNLALFIDNSLALGKLRKLSKPAEKQQAGISLPMTTEPYASVEYQQLKICKSLENEEKGLAKVKHDQRIFSKEKKKILQQNQDLIDTVNSLFHEKKYLQNLVRIFQHQMRTKREKRKANGKFILATSRQHKNRRQSKPTAFQRYLQFQTSRRMKTNPSNSQL